MNVFPIDFGRVGLARSLAKTGSSNKTLFYAGRKDAWNY